MYNIEDGNKLIIKRYKRKLRFFNIIGIIVLCIVLFVQEQLFVKLLTVVTTLLIYAMLKSAFSVEKKKVDCIKNNNYRLLETTVEGFEYTNLEIYEYKPSKDVRFLKFKDSDLLFKVEKVDRRFKTGDKVVIQIVEYDNKEYIVNVLKLD